MGGSGSRSLMRLQSRCWPILPSSEGFTGARESASKVILTHGHWPGVSVPRQVGQ